MNATWLDVGLLGRVRSIVRPWRCLLVGGAVRDHLLARPAYYDLDLLTVGDEGVGDEVAAALARELPAKLIPIGGERFAALRLVSEEGTIDLWHGGTTPLEDELARRDLTINALAVELADGALRDPHGGRRDLDHKVLRATTETSFDEDPLRILRLARLAAELDGFEVEERTLDLAAAAIPALPEIAAERRREELGRSLRAPNPLRALEVWCSVGFYPALLADAPTSAGQGAARDFAAARRVAEHFHRLTANWEPEATGAPPGAGGPPAPDPFVLHVVLLLANAGADIEELLQLGYVSRREARDVALVLPHRELPRATADQRWLLHSAGHCWPTALCFAAVVGPAGSPEPDGTLADIVALARERSADIFDPTPLVRGDEVRRLLELEAGPEVGVMVRRLRRRQVEGRLEDRAAALRWLASERRSADAD